MKRWLPLGIFVGLAILLGIGLGLDPREVPSPLIGKSMPTFELPQLADAERTVSDTSVRSTTITSTTGT